jgi:hypothetical protein
MSNTITSSKTEALAHNIVLAAEVGVTGLYIMRSKATGDRFVQWVDKRGRKNNVPLEIAAMSVGSHAWLKKVACACKHCRQPVAVGAGDIAGVCDTCFEAACEENAALDAAN